MLEVGEPAGTGWWGLSQLPAAPGPGMVKLAQAPHLECKLEPKSGVGWGIRICQAHGPGPGGFFLG